MAETSIEWTDATWNPVAGCSIATAGCTNCYAMRMAARLEAMGVDKYTGTTRKSGGRAKWTGKIVLDPGALTIPMTWKKPRKVFVNSMSDLFHPDVPVEFISQVWATMAATPRHTYQILTKRPERRRDQCKCSRHAPRAVGTSCVRRWKFGCSRRADHAWPQPTRLLPQRAVRRHLLQAFPYAPPLHPRYWAQLYDSGAFRFLNRPTDMGEAQDRM